MIDEQAGTVERRRRPFLSLLNLITVRNDHVPVFSMQAPGDAALPGSCQQMSHFALMDMMDVTSKGNIIICTKGGNRWYEFPESNPS